MIIYKLNINSSITLTYEEKQWLDKNPIIKIAVMNYWKHDNDGNSIHTDLLKLLNQYGKLNLIPVRFDTWEDGFNEAVKGDNVYGIMNLSWSKNREKYFYYTKPYNYTPNYLIVKHRNFETINKHFQN
jgi:hypothetical protein